MRRHLVFLLAALCLGAAASSEAQNLLDGPDQSSYDEANDRYLVCSSLGQDIVSINLQGEQSYYLTNLGSYLFGNLISGDTLYVGDSRGSVRAFNLNTKQLLWTKFVTGGHYFGGLAIDASGYLYIADNQAFTSKIYKMKISDQTWETFVGSGLGGYTNKVIYDEPNNRLLVTAHYENSPILAVDLLDASLTPLVTPPNCNVGGITMDNDRNVYVTDYYQGVIYRYDQTFTNPPVFIAQSDYSHACGLSYDHVHNLLIVSHLEDDVVEFVSLNDSDGDGIIDLNDNCLDQPNPDQSDLDVDRVGDSCDNCLTTYNPDQQDLNKNNIGDACEGCCQGRVGDANGEGEYPDEITLGDIMLLVDVKFISGDCSKLPCLSEADVTQDGGSDPTCEENVTLGDIMTLVDFLFITGPDVATLLECP
jgi:hypothetical protein